MTEDAVAEEIVCGPDAWQHVAAIKKYVTAGFDHVTVHQVGPDPDGFFAFYEREVLPRLTPVTRAAGASRGPSPDRRSTSVEAFLHP